jgi:hypothetical protein
MTTKYSVKRAIAKDGEKTTFQLLGTAILFNDPKAGIIRPRPTGTCACIWRTRSPPPTTKEYVVSKEKPTKEEGKAISHEFGTFVLQPTNERATLFLHLLNESFPCWVREDRPAQALASTGASAAAPA